MFKIGDKGEKVKKLQETLKDNGYDVEVDGVYGEQTDSAFKDFELKEPNYKMDTPAVTPPKDLYEGDNASSNTSSENKTESTFDDAYFRTLSELQNITKPKPTYTNSYDEELNNLYAKIIGREDFSYNVNEDSLYKQYADQYIQQGRLASQDAMGQASALTGGYANSYAQSVGQQTYQGYVQGLNNVIPELYQQALNRYTTETDNLINQYAATQQQADAEYQKYQNELNNYYQDISLAQSARATAMSEVSSLLAMGATPTEQQIKATGLSTEQYNAMKTYLASANTSVKRESVSSMSSKELVDAIEGFAMTGKETGYKELLVFLEDCTKTGRLTDEEAANYWYEMTGQQRPSFD